MAIENYCIDCKTVAKPDCDQRGHIIGTLGQSLTRPTNQSHEPERMVERPTVPCQLCSKQTPMLDTKLCDRCWELKTRIESDPELAQIVIDKISTGNTNAFASLWSTAPRSRTARIEREDAEWWWRQGQRSVTETVTEDLREIHRLVSERIKG